MVFRQRERRRAIFQISDVFFGKMQQDGIASAPLASDEEFLRRVTLDLTGQIPDVATLQSFVSDRTPDKRTQ